MSNKTLEQLKDGDLYLGGYRLSDPCELGFRSATEAAISQFVETLLPIESNSWVDKVRRIATSRYTVPDEELTGHLDKLRTGRMTIGKYLLQLVEHDFDIESEPEGGDGSAVLKLEDEALPALLLVAEGNYWSEYQYDSKDPSIDISKLDDGEIELLAMEEKIDLVDSSIDWHVEVNARLESK